MGNGKSSAAVISHQVWNASKSQERYGRAGKSFSRTTVYDTIIRCTNLSSPIIIIAIIVLGIRLLKVENQVDHGACLLHRSIASGAGSKASVYLLPQVRSLTPGAVTGRSSRQ